MSEFFSGRLSDHLIQSGSLPNCQFAYRSGRGSCDLLVILDQILQSSLDRGAEARVVQLDFSAAFDRVNHGGLVYKLQAAGVGGTMLNVLRQFLTDRRHRVCVDGGVGQWSPVISGVPQGSVLGPILFMLYTSDLPHVVDSQVFCYADDTTLVAPISCPADRVAVGLRLNDDLSNVKAWCERWDMKLNPAKSKSLLVSRSRTVLPEHPTLEVDGVVVKEDDTLKVLGVTLDKRMTYEDHVRSVVAQARQKTGIMRKAARIFEDNNVLSRCLKAYVLPLVEYCSPVWSSSAGSHLALLDRAFSVASEIGGGVNVDLAHRRKVGSVSLFFKIYNDSSHPMHSMLPGPHARRSRTRSTSQLHDFALEPVRSRTHQYDRVFLNRCVALWNGLPGFVFSNSLSKFKSSINKVFM